jgi:hypothetical protein
LKKEEMEISVGADAGGARARLLYNEEGRSCRGWEMAMQRLCRSAIASKDWKYYLHQMPLTQIWTQKQKDFLFNDF